MKFIIVIACIAVFLSACSSEPEMTGLWKNGDNSTLKFVDDTTAVMGQEGVEGEATGIFWSKGDTVWVKSAMDAEVDMFNLFTFYLQKDSLYLVSISLSRSGDMQTLNGSEFAQRLGKSYEELAFVKSGTSKK
jgi:PBP1b-binding outer membrane lipoprotein LpoB